MNDSTPNPAPPVTQPTQSQANTSPSTRVTSIMDTGYVPNTGSAQPKAKTPKKSNSLTLILTIILILTILIGIWVYFNPPILKNEETTEPTPQPTIITNSTPIITVTPIVSSTPVLTPTSEVTEVPANVPTLDR